MTDNQKLALDLRAQIQRLIIENSDISGYFFRRTMAPPSKAPTAANWQERTRVYAVADLLLTHFGAILELARRSGGRPPEFWDPYLEYVRFVGSKSQTLRFRFEKHPGLYDAALDALLTAGPLPVPVIPLAPPPPVP